MEVERQRRQEERRFVLADSFESLYFGHVPVRSAAWAQLREIADRFVCAAVASGGEDQVLELREELENVLSGHRLAKMYPVSPVQQRAAARWLERAFSNSSDSMEEEKDYYDDELPEPEFVFKTFDRLSPDGKVLVTLLEENRDLIGKGTTGLTSWQGALFLTDWATTQGRKHCQNRRVLELGCGTGLLGITLLKMLQIPSYTFTDCHFRVINAVVQNIELNLGESSQDCDIDIYDRRLKQLQTGPGVVVSEESVKTIRYDKKCNNSLVKVRHLDWTDVNRSNLIFGDFDLLLAADVVYERSLLPHLSCVIAKFLQSGIGKCAFVSCTERSPTTLSEFESCLANFDLDWQVCFRGRYSPGSSQITSDVQHQFTRVYQVTSKVNKT